MARPGLMKHPKFKRLVKLLGEPAPHARGYLELIWDVGYECGNSRIGDATDIELAAEFPGTEGKLCKALVECRLIDERDGMFYIHDLFENAPDYVQKRHRREIERKNKHLQENCPVTDRRLEPGRTEMDALPHAHAHPHAHIDKRRGTDVTAEVGVTEKADKPDRTRKQASGAHHELIRRFCDGWKARYQADYVFVGGKEGKQIKRVLDHAKGDLEEAWMMLSAYLADDDSFVLENHHSLGIFISRINCYRGTAPAASNGNGVAPRRKKMSREEEAQLDLILRDTQ